MIGRLQHLEKMGLAARAGPGEWMIGLEAERSLRDLGMRAISSKPCTAPSPRKVGTAASATMSLMRARAGGDHRPPGGQGPA